MRHVVINTDDIQSVIWPKKCSGCGAEIGTGSAPPYNVKIEAGIGAAFAGSAPAALSVALCDQCTARLSSLKTQEIVGWVLAGLGFGIPWFMDSFNVPLLLLCVGLFWGGAFTRYNATRQLTKIGIRCIRASKNKWDFQLRSDKYADEFAKCNAKLIENK